MWKVVENGGQLILGCWAQDSLRVGFESYYTGLASKFCGKAVESDFDFDAGNSLNASSYTRDCGNATGGTNNTLIDVNTFRGGDDTYNGKLVLVTDASDGTTQTTQYVNDYTASNNTIQFQQNASFTVASSVPTTYSPIRMEHLRNQNALAPR